MNPFRDCLFAFSMMVALPACSAPTDTGPEPQPSPTSPAPTPMNPGEITASWKAAAGRAFTSLASAAAGDEGAIAYAEQETMSAQTRIKLQRLDSAGATRGDAIELGVTASGISSGLTIASDGSRYVVCWDAAAQISCAAASVGQGSASSGPPIVGAAPALAYNAGTWALAYATSEHLAVVKLTSDGVAAGSPVLFDAGQDPSWGQIPLLAATKLGFVLVGGFEVRVHQLGFGLAPIAAPLDLGIHSGYFGAIAASGTKVAINHARPYESSTFFLDGAALQDEQVYEGGGKGGLPVVLAMDGSSIGMLSASDTHGSASGLVYRTLAPNVAPVRVEVLPADHRSYDHAPLTLLRLKDAMFLAVSPSYSGEEITVARAHQP